MPDSTLPTTTTPPVAPTRLFDSPGHHTRQTYDASCELPREADGQARRHHNGAVRLRLEFPDKPVTYITGEVGGVAFKRIDRSVSRAYTIFPYRLPTNVRGVVTTMSAELENYKSLNRTMKKYGLRAYRRLTVEGALPFVQPNGSGYWRTAIRYPEWIGDQIICVTDTVGSFPCQFIAYHMAADRIEVALAHLEKYKKFAREKGFEMVGTLDSSPRLYANSDDRSTCRPMTQQEIIDLEHDYYDDCITVPRRSPEEQAAVSEHIRMNMELRRESLRRSREAARRDELIKIADGILDRQIRAELAAEHAEQVRRANLTPAQLAQEARDKELDDLLGPLDD